MCWTCLSVETSKTKQAQVPIPPMQCTVYSAHWANFGQQMDILGQVKFCFTNPPTCKTSSNKGPNSLGLGFLRQCDDDMMMAMMLKQQ